MRICCHIYRHSQSSRQELLPFILEGLDDDDEVLLAVALSLGRMIDTADHTLLWKPLEVLLTLEETTIRQAATSSSLLILQSTTDASEFGLMVKRLGEKEWFTARVSAAGLLSAAYARTEDAECIALFIKLCRDETPMVRRIAAKHLGEFCQTLVRMNVHPDELQNLLPLYQELANIDQPDSVRLQTTENCVLLGGVCQDTQVTEKLIPLIVATIDDRSWRVRWTAASKFASVVANFDDTVLIDAYEKLLQDPEAEVRTAATMNLALVSRSKTIAERLVQRVTSLTEDESEHVRAALALVATELAPMLGRDSTITYLVPPVLLLLRDAASQVRLNLIASLAKLNQVIGVDLLSQSLLPAILDLGADRQWRIRKLMIEHIRSIAEQLGCEFFTEKLNSLCLGWLVDDIASIREAAAANLKELTAVFGTDWAVRHLIPSIIEVREHPSYLRRLTALQALYQISTAMDAPSVSTHILPVILEMSTDIVPNIRFNVAKELGRIGSSCGSSDVDLLIIPVLKVLEEDDDRDVRHYARVAIRSLQGETN